jgi:FkbM family methyltransferase
MGRGLYRGPVKEFLVRSGIKLTLQDWYWSVLSRTVEPDQQVSVNGASATFRVETYDEYCRVENVRDEERPVVERLLRELKPDDTFWDVGACTGTFSVLATEVVTDGSVVAFEPYPPNVASLRKNVAVNNANVQIVEKALSDSAGKATFRAQYSLGEGTQEGSIEDEYVDANHTMATVSVERTPGEEVTESGIEPPDVIKIDVEGHGPAAVEGMGDRLTPERCRTVIVEPHDNGDRLRRLLADRGYEFDEVVLGSDRGETDTTTIVGQRPAWNAG